MKEKGKEKMKTVPIVVLKGELCALPARRRQASAIFRRKQISRIARDEEK